MFFMQRVGNRLVFFHVKVGCLQNSFHHSIPTAPTLRVALTVLGKLHWILFYHLCVKTTIDILECICCVIVRYAPVLSMDKAGLIYMCRAPRFETFKMNSFHACSIHEVVRMHRSAIMKSYDPPTKRH